MFVNQNPDENLSENNECSEKEQDFNQSCEKIAHQKAKISLPLSIEPFAITGKIKTKCCGNPIVLVSPCNDHKEGCHYVITQEVCIEFPIKFGAFTEIECSHVECGKLHFEDLDQK